MLRIYCIILVWFGLTANNAYAQTRQSDSMRNKQLSYNRLMQQQKQQEEQRKAQELAKAEAKKNSAVVVAYDSKGNKIETTQVKQGRHTLTTTTTTTIIIPPPPPILNRPVNPDTINTDSIALQVVKSKNRLQVWYKGKVITAYKCVFGPTFMQQKCMEGDRCTPEGSFTIQTCKDHHKWDKFMLLDYPNEESRRQFEENKRKGIIPAHANIGGLIGIHGIWLNGDNVIDLKHNWTDGCISLKNKDVEELAKLVKPGVTKVTIIR